MASMLPTSWWLFWWSVGLVATAVLVVWFVRASRRADADARRELEARADVEAGTDRQGR